MVQVPIAPNRQVQVQPLDRRPLRYARSRNLVGEAVTEFGSALREGAEQWDAIEAAYDQAEVVDRDNRYAMGIAEAAVEFGNLKGEAPAQQLKDRLSALEQQREELLGGARSERSRNLMKRNLDVRFANARIGMQKHADAEMFKFRDDGLASSIEIASKDAVRGYGTEQFGLNLATAKLRLGERGRLNGWAPERLKEEDAKLDAAIRYDTVISLATQGEPTEALQLAEEWQKQFSPEQYSKLNQLLRPRAEAKEARALAPVAIEEYIAGMGKTAGSAPANPAGRVAPVENGKAVAEQVYPGINVTSNRRKAGEAGKAGSKSWHVKSGGAVDAAPIPGMTFAQYVQGYKDAGYTIIEALDETDPATMKRTGATGPHWHVVLGEKGSSSGTSGGTALDPRMDPEIAEKAARAKAKALNLSETQTDALIEAARDYSADLMRRRNVIEQEEERQFDKMVVDKGIDLDNVTSESQLPADAWAGLSPSSQLQKRQQFARNKERIAKEREAAVQAARLQQAIIAGGAVDYADPETKKAADNLYAQQLAARGRMDAQQLMSFNVQFATQTGMIPPVLRGQIRGQLRSADAQAQLAAAATIAEIGARNPAILGDFSQEEIARAEQLNYYRQRGVPAADAVNRVGEMERLTKTDRTERSEQFKVLAKKAGGAEDVLEDAFGTTGSPALVGEFTGLWEQEFVRTGDIDLARATALASLKRAWGVSRVNGREQVMKGAPELHYGRIDKGPADARWIREQAFKELFGGGMMNPGAEDRFELRPWNRTVDGQPVYIGTLRQPDGTIVTAVDGRGRPKLYRPDYATSDEYKRRQKRQGDTLQQARRRRAGAAPTPRPSATSNPGWKL